MRQMNEVLSHKRWTESMVLPILIPELMNNKHSVSHHLKVHYVRLSEYSLINSKKLRQSIVEVELEN